MSKLLSIDRFLIVGSIGWLITLHFVPGFHANKHAFCVSIGMVAVNAMWSLWTISRKRQVLIGLNTIQIILFGVLAFQLSCAYGADNYLSEYDPRFYDWAEFTAAHVLRAADLLHVLGEYGVRIQNVTHNSVAAGMMLVCMHLAVDIFLLGLLCRLIARCWPSSPQRSSLQQGRRTCGWLLFTLVLYVGMAAALRLQPLDWLLWPIENLMRSVDIGDIFQIFHWRLHHGDRGFWASTAAVAFRLVADVWFAKIVILLRLTVFQSWGLSTARLIELLVNGNVLQRRAAAKGLAWGGAHAEQAIPALVYALRDGDSGVRCSAARALGRMGPRAKDAATALSDRIWVEEDRAFRAAALDAFSRIRGAATRTSKNGDMLLSVNSEHMATLVKQADAAEPQAAQEPDTVQSGERLPYQASAKRRAIQALILDLLGEAFFSEERDITAIRTALAATGHQCGSRHLSSSMQSLTKKGHFSRRKSDRNRWLYKGTTAPGIGDMLNC